MKLMKKTIAASGLMLMAASALVCGQTGSPEESTAAVAMKPASVAGAPSAAALQNAEEIGTDLLRQALWKVETQTYFTPNSRLVLLGGDLLVRRDGQVLELLDGSTGKPLWELPITKLEIQASPRMIYELIDSSGPGAGLAFSSGMVGSGGDAFLGGITLPGGTHKWQAKFQGFVPLPVVDGQQIITGAATETHHVSGSSPGTYRGNTVAMDVRALDRDTGRQKWSTPLPFGTLNTGKPLVVGEQVFLVADLSTLKENHCRLLALSTRDGTILYQIPLRDDLLSPPALVNGELVSVSSNAKVVGLDPGTGKEKWQVAISPDYDPTRSTFTSIQGYQFLENPPVVAGDKILVPVVGATNPSTGPRGRGFEDQTSGLAAFDVRTHKQVWYFAAPADKGVGDPVAGAPARRNYKLWLHEVKSGGDLILAKGSGSIGGKPMVLGIDRQQGKLLFVIPGSYPFAMAGNKAYLTTMRTAYAIPVEVAGK